MLLIALFFTPLTLAVKKNRGKKGQKVIMQKMTIDKRANTIYPYVNFEKGENSTTMDTMDSTQAGGTQGANFAGSPGADKPHSFDPEAFAQQLEERIMARFSDPKLIQSQKDKVLDAVRKDKGLKDLYAEFQKMQETMTPEQVELEIWKRDMESRIAGQSAGRVTAPQTSDYEEVLEELKLNGNDPEVTRLLASGDTQTRKLAGLTALAVRKQAAAVSPALVAQSAGSGPEPADLMAEYRAKAANVRGMALIDLKMEFRKKGLDIS